MQKSKRNKTPPKSLSFIPTEEDFKTPEFKQVWECIKTWKIKVPDDEVRGDDVASGSHVLDILISMGKRNPKDYEN